MSCVINIIYCNNNNKFVTNTYKKYKTIKCVLSENDLNKPMIDYFLANNIKRRCWTIDGKWINVSNTFFDPNKQLIGFYDHVNEICNQTNCDLVTYCKAGMTPSRLTMYKRFTIFDFKFVGSNYCQSFIMNLPLIATKKIILQLFSDTMIEISKKYESFDFDLYFVKKYTYNNSKHPLYYKIEYDDKFVIDFNQKNCCPTLWPSKSVYVIRAIISLKYLYQILQYFSKDLIDIIYNYGDLKTSNIKFELNDF